MKRKLVNYGQSVRARLLALANEKGIQLEYVLLRYALERFLYRLGQSQYADRFLLKGASAFAVWLGPFCRVTRDADLEAFGDATPERLAKVFREICTLSCPEDGVEFDLNSFATEEIKKEDKYPGTRITFLAFIGGARVTVQLDIAVGDSVYPAAETMVYPVLLGGAAPHVQVYPRYTVVAEKFQVMVSRGLLNSRLKDYYDIWLLTHHFEFDFGLLRTALERTFERRKTALPKGVAVSLSNDFAAHPAKQLQWKAFLDRAHVETLELKSVTNRLISFLSPVLANDHRSTIWNNSVGQWMSSSEFESR